MSAPFSFRCTRCGECCTNLSDERVVALMPTEDRTIASALGMSIDAFHACTELVEDFRDTGLALRVLKAPDGRCTFLRDDNLCGIHTHKPFQCRESPDRFMTGGAPKYPCLADAPRTSAGPSSRDIEFFRLFIRKQEE